MKDTLFEELATEPKQNSKAQNGTANKPGLLDHIEKIIKLSAKYTLEGTLLEKASANIRHVSKTLDITDVQAMLFAHFVNRWVTASVYSRRK
jgi:hypothetical protein